MTWNEVLMYIINGVFKIVITLLIPYGIRLIKAKLTNDMQIKYVDLAKQMIIEAVEQVQQTYVDNMKAEDLFDAKAQAMRLAIRIDNANKAKACGITLTVGSVSYTISTEDEGTTA